ncbi:MAG: dihydrolipoyl dehydrogenase [Campylobacterota bacterium]|nr:dihydrolipoyl dehydrogenase [Campylobacterota bacterium]
MKKYEVVIIGAGPAGYQSALELANAGVKVLLIDRSKENIGGTCLNRGCIPTKNYLESAKFASRVDYFKDCGVDIEFKGLDLKKLKDKTKSLKDEIRIGVLWKLEQSKAETIFGDAKFIGTDKLSVDDKIIEFEKCIIATGSKVREIEHLPIDGKIIISSSDIFELESLPKTITIVGGGAISCEMATFFNTFGVKVTLIVRNNRLIPNEDEDISKALLRVFKKQNVKVVFSTTIERTELNKNSVKLFLKDSEEIIESEFVLSAVGRIPNIESLTLENAKVEEDSNGFIKVDQYFQTSQKNIYAIGDCIDTQSFAHTAYAEAKITVQNIINGNKITNTHISPSTIFTNPSIASCGINEKEAIENDYEIEIKKVFFKVNAKAKIIGDDSGFAKVIVCAKSGIIVGCSIIGVDATEIIHEMLIVIEKKITIKELRKLIHAHPTVSEIISYL